MLCYNRVWVGRWPRRCSDCRNGLRGNHEGIDSTTVYLKPAAQALPTSQDGAETEYETETVYETESEELDQKPVQRDMGAVEVVASPKVATMPRATPKSTQVVTILDVRDASGGGAAAAPGRSSVGPIGIGGLWQSSVGGWVIAMSLLAAIRMSREQADAERLDISTLQLRQQESRVQSAELRDRRRTFLEAERRGKEIEAARRLQEVRAQAEEAERDRVARDEAYRADMAKETARLWEQQEAARKMFEAQDSLMIEELSRRTEVEVRLRIEAEKKKVEEREKARAEQAERARVAAERAKAAAEAERVRLEEQAAARAMEKGELRKLQTSFTACFVGSVAVQPAPFNTMTSHGRVQQLARIQLDVQLALRDSSPPIQVQRLESYESVDAAMGDSERLAARVCEPLVSEAASALKEAPDSAGMQARPPPSSMMDLHEINYWARLCLAGCEARCRQAISQVTPLAGSSRLEEGIKVECVRAMLPAGHPMRMDSRLMAAAGLVAATKLQEAVAIIDRVVEDEEDALGQAALPQPSRSGYRSSPAADPFGFFGASASTSYLQLPPLLVPALVYAQLMDRAAGAAGAQAPPAVALILPFEPAASQPSEAREAAGTASAVPVGEPEAAELESAATGAAAAEAAAPESTVPLADPVGESSSPPSPSAPPASPPSSPPDSAMLALARYQLEQRVRQLQEDELIPTARVLLSTLGSRHPICRVMVELADRTTSKDTRRAAERKLAAEEQALQAQVERKEVGRESFVDPNSTTSRRTLSPVPERLWAMRNVANSMVRTGDTRQLGEAVGMLEQADSLALEHYGQYHPARLAAVLDLHEAITSSLLQAASGSFEAKDDTAKLVDVTDDAVSIVQALVERYGSQRDALSVVLLCEAAVQEYAALLPSQNPEIKRLRVLAQEEAAALTPVEMRVVLSKRVSGGTTLLRAVAKDFTEELGAYSLARRNSKVEQWNKGMALGPLSR